MTSLVTDFIVNPVIRQARRFSLSSFTTIVKPQPESPSRPSRSCRYSQQENVISEADEFPYLGDGPDERKSTSSSSQNPVLANQHPSIAGLGQESCRPNRILPDHDLPSPPDLPISEPHPCEHEPPGESAPAPVPVSVSVPESVNATNMAAVRLSDTGLSTQAGTRRRVSLPEDDGMGELRKRIFTIQARDIDPSEKARLMHQLLSEGYAKSRGLVQIERSFTPSSPRPIERRSSQGQRPLESFKFWHNPLSDDEFEADFDLTEDDIRPTFAPRVKPDESAEDIEDSEDSEYRPLGCEHYRRNVKLQCSTCHRWYTCRFCHDKVEDHNLIRKETRNMLCMFCGTAQRAGEACVACGESAARYYCGICKLWNDDPDKPCYHCNDCGICRIGRGIGKDFFHCKKCCACIAISMELDHKCIERATDCDCPICGDYMFTSPKAVCFMKCGHSIHRQCFQEHMQSSYKCPICNKSLVNMESQFRNLDIAIQSQPMPPEFRDTRAVVLCNDCSAKSSTMYHWLGLKCSVCLSYNTAQLQILGLATNAIEPDFGERNAQLSGLASPSVPDVSGSRDIRRRHSSNVTSSIIPEHPLEPPGFDRLARSVSPVPTPGHSLHASTVGGSLAGTEDEEEGQDMIGFWSRVPRSIASNEDQDEDEDVAVSSDEESVLTSDEEIEQEDGDESDHDDFELLGHR
ncbi:hypothetical protein F4809DRAFT_610319 [Biscogniauxia mediterranea]|nr:hypothetical protein F4809DRAFT_610319 [Biscogniauxia mediterranea]